MPHYGIGLPFELEESPFTKDMRERLDGFTARYENGHIKFTDQGKTYTCVNPYLNKTTTFSQYMAYLVSEYIHLSDSVKEQVHDYEAESDSNEKYEIKFRHSAASQALHAIGMKLLHAIEQGRGGFIDEGFDKELNDLKTEKEDLRSQNERLKAEIEKWKSDYKDLETRYSILDQINRDRFSSGVQGGDSNHGSD